MMSSSREGYEAKQEGGDNNNINTFNIEKFSKASSSSTSRQWSSSSGFRNPRIVRVSRSFGGKDRHSKVCTIRGLRDRRIRLSVPTAIQLYDLQDKLGLNQPSKVIDWLLEATKFDIDKLPPLQFPQGFSQFHHIPQTLLPFHQPSNASHELSLGPLYDANSTFVGIQNLMAKSRFMDIDSSNNKGKEAQREYISEKGKWNKTNEEENIDQDGDFNSPQKLFPMGGGGAQTHHHHSTLHGFLNNPMSYNNYHSEPSSLSLSQFGSHGLFHSQQQQQQQQVDPHHHINNGLQFLPPSLPLLPSGSQLLFSPSASAAPSSHFSTSNPFSLENNDPRQFNNFQFLNSSGSSNSQGFTHPLISSLHSFNSSQTVRPFPTHFSSKLMDSDNNNKGSNARD